MKKQVVRSMIAMLCAVGIVGGITGCGNSTEEKQANQVKEADTSKDTTQESANGGPATVEEPITIELWHTRGEGKNGDEMARVVDEFNKTNEYGITVESTYIGAYDETLSKAVTAIGAGDNPTLVLLAATPGVDTLASMDCLADLTPYIERDNFDLDNINEAFTYKMYYNDEIISMPYVRSCTVILYNKDLFDKAGISDIPTDWAEFSKACKTVTEKTGAYGFITTPDATYFQNTWLRSMGGDGIISQDGNGASCLDDGTMETLLTDWLHGVEDGWMMQYDPTNSDAVNEAFSNGRVAAVSVSSGSLTSYIDLANEAGITLGTASMPGYSGKSTAEIGGGNIAIIKNNSNDQQIAAAWEFIKCLLEDENVATNAINTGYLPITNSSIQTEQIQNLWKEDSRFTVGWDSLQNGTEVYYSSKASEWRTSLQEVFDYVIVDKSMTPKEAVDYLKNQEAIIF